MLVVGFSVGQEPNVLTAGQYVLNYLSFPDPDATGNYQTLTCTVGFTAGDLYQSADNIWVQRDLLTLFLARSTLGLVKARRHLTRSPVVSLAWLW